MTAYLKETSIDTKEVIILPSSHIGGHEFAGTLIVYPRADWYGRVTRANATSILVSILKGEQHPDCLRGGPKW